MELFVQGEAMNWELAAAREALKILDRCLQAEHRDGVLATLAHYPANEEAQAASRYVQTVLGEAPLIRN